MDFTIPSELVALRESFRSFVDREVRPIEDALAEELTSYAPDRDRLYEAAMQVKARSVAAGFYAPYMPEKVGGADLSTLGTALLVEEAAKSGSRFAMMTVAPPNPSGPSTMLLDLSEHLWDDYVRPVVAGEKTMCFALTEPEAGSDAQSIRTTARRDGDSWVIDGRKHYITNGDRADFAVVFALTDAEKRGSGGITAFVVPRDQLTTGRIQWSIADSHPAELILDGARVPADHVVGEVGLGFVSAMRFLDAGRAFIGAQCLGLAEYAVETAVAHASTREAFGKPLIRNQGVSFPLARSKVDVEAMRWLTYHLAWLVDRGELAIVESSIVKYHNTELAYGVADRCVQAMGGMGIVREGPLERVLRHLRMLRVVEGASEVQLLVIARSLGL